MSQRVICVIMGGGRGTRLHPLTKARCKPAVPLAGKYRLVDIPISNCLNSGLNRIHVLTQFNTASLHRHIQSAYKFDPYGGGFVDILSAEQTEAGEAWYQGTADAVRQNLHHFDARDDDLFLILSGDQLYRMDFAAVIAHHNATKADVTIAAKALPSDEVSAFGVMRVDDQFMIQEFVEKPQDPAVVQQLLLSDALQGKIEAELPADPCLANMGIYVFNKKTLYEALSADISQTDFGKEVIPAMLGKKRMAAYVYNGYWEDIGTVESFFEANLKLTDPVPEFNFFDKDKLVYTNARYLPASKLVRVRVDRAAISNGCIISDTQIDRCMIGVRSRIAGGSYLRNVVMMGCDFFESDEDRAHNKAHGLPDAGVGRNVHIEQAIIDKNARIGDNVKLSPKGKPDLWEQGDVFVRDGVLIVNKNGVVPDGTVIGDWS